MSLIRSSITWCTIMELGLAKINEVFTLILTNQVLSKALSTTDMNTMSLKRIGI